MKKSLLFLSAAITIFILVILANLLFVVKTSVVDANASSNASTAVPTITDVPTDTNVPVDTPTTQPTNTAIPSPTIAAFISPQEAVFIASSALGNTNVYSVDTVNRYGMDVYQVNFSSGSIVFVSPQGHILTITALQSNVVQSTSNQQPSSNNPPAKTNQQPSQQHDDQGGDD